MKHRWIVLAFLLPLATLLGAQQVDWLKSDPVIWDLNPAMPEHAIASAPGYLVAMRSASVSMGGSLDVFGTVALERLDPLTGSSIWTCFIGDSVSLSDVVVSENGIAYFAGQFKEDVLQLCDGSILPYVGNAIDENAFVIAWDLEADELLWAKNLTGEVGGWHRIAALAIDPNGDVWYGMTDFFEGLIGRIDANGDAQEVRTITECKTIGSISFDPWGGLYVSGSTDGSGFTYAGQMPEVTGQYNMFVLRYRPDGSAGFAVFAEDITFQSPKVVATHNGHAYLAGNVFDATDWNGFPVNGADWVSATFIAGLDSTGTFQWLVESDPPGGTITGDVEIARGNCIAVDATDRLFFTGTLRGQVDWGNGVVSDGLTLGARTLTVVAFDPDGQAQWAVSSPPGGNLWAQSITAMAGADAIHFQAHITSEFSMNGQTTNTGGSQAAMVGRIGGIPTTVSSVHDRSQFALWPNPAGDRVFVQLPIDKKINAAIHDGVGKWIRDLLLGPGVNTIGTAQLRPGFYSIRCDDGATLMLIKE